MSSPSTTTRHASGLDVYLFFALALGITWLLDLPWVLAVLQHRALPPYAMAMTGLGALGPTLAALIVAAWRRDLRGTFGRWRASPWLILLALAVSPLVHVVANVIEVLLGGHPAHWFYPPREPERLAALIMFPLGEEFGWRGFAYPRLADRHGPVLGSLILGCFWTLWHLGMMFAPGKLPDLVTFGSMLALLCTGSVIAAWLMEKSHRSIAVAIAFHAGAHLDNESRAPESEVRLRVLRLLVFALAAVLAARALQARRPARTAGAT